MLEALHVSAGYNGNTVLHDISFKLSRGERLSLIGPNGSGKTTLLKAIARLIDFEGDIYIENASVKSMKRKALGHKVSFFRQMPQIYFDYTVFETVLMGRYAYQNSGLFSSFSKEDKRLTIDALKKVHMLKYKDRGLLTLSGGELQRVFLAKILVAEPEIILLDEPTNHLDLSYQVELISFLKDYSREQGITIISVLHDLNLALSLSDNLLLLDNGKSHGIIKAGDINSSESLNRVYNMDVGSYMRIALKKWETASGH